MAGQHEALRGLVGEETLRRMEAASRATSPRCDKHPESPTGYVGTGKWCDYKRAAYAAEIAR